MNNQKFDWAYDTNRGTSIINYGNRNILSPGKAQICWSYCEYEQTQHCPPWTSMGEREILEVPKKQLQRTSELSNYGQNTQSLKKLTSLLKAVKNGKK